jgi:hypothetical protein
VLLSSFIATVFVSAYLAKRESPPPSRRNYAAFYRFMAWVMLGTFIAIVALHFWQPHFFGVLWVTILESAVTIEFCAYWVVQTIDLWDSPDRRDRLCTADRELLARKATTNRPTGIKSQMKDMMSAPQDERLLLFL